MAEILVYLIAAIITIIHYVIDEKREKNGLTQKYRQDIGSISGGGMDYINFYRSEIENIKLQRESLENERRASYIMSDDNAAMETVKVIGTIAPKLPDTKSSMDAINSKN